MTNLALKTTIIDIEKEYQDKVLKINQTLQSYKDSIQEVKNNSCVMGSYGDLKSPECYSLCKQSIFRSLKVSAWRLVYERCHIEKLASESIKKQFQQSLSNPPEFTIENALNTFGDIIINPRKSIIEAFAEVFTRLDQSYKSHEKVKIGVKGLPKRIILSAAGDTYGWGFDRLKSVINALAVYEGKELVSYDEIRKLQDTGGLKERGLSLKLFNNGNGHLYFDKDQLNNINKALAEYYGDVLADCSDTKTSKAQTTEVCKDLQFYPTPKELVRGIVDNYYLLRTGSKVLEPSCGEGNIMDVLRNEKGLEVDGVEVSLTRANKARAKGHNVYVGNFLETEPTPNYDYVFMNPPFYGRHYVKHVEHAKKFLKEGGSLIAILPITARDDHKILEGGSYDDLPAKSFKDSGTNINTVLYKWVK